jgi:TonB-dependent SusC/RagA subfamily outer membrane receptor
MFISGEVSSQQKYSVTIFMDCTIVITFNKGFLKIYYMNTRSILKTFIRNCILCINFLIFLLNSASGQKRICLDAGCGPINKINPLVFVDSFKTDISYLVLDPNKIESINILKDSLAISKYGVEAKNGVIIIQPKSDVQLLRIDRILDNNKIKGEDRKLRICINKTLIRETQLILVESSEIEDVQITTGRHWINSEDANSCERFINIITKTKDKN